MSERFPPHLAPRFPAQGAVVSALRLLGARQQQTLCKELGFTQGTLSRIEAGNGILSEGQRARVARALGREPAAVDALVSATAARAEALARALEPTLPEGAAWAQALADRMGGDVVTQLANLAVRVVLHETENVDWLAVEHTGRKQRT